MCVQRPSFTEPVFSKKSGQKMTKKLSARHRTRSSKSQADIGAESSTSLHTVVSVGSPASFGGASLVALMAQLSVPSPLPTSDLAYEESLKENEEALAKPSLLQPSPVPSLNLTSLQLQSVVESLSSNLCFLYSMFVASIVKSDRFQLWSFQLTRAQLCRQKSSSMSFQLTTAELCSSAAKSFESLQQKELEAAYVFMAQFQDSPTRARQLQLSIGNLRECSTRASQLAVDQLDAFRNFQLLRQKVPVQQEKL